MVAIGATKAILSKLMMLMLAVFVAPVDAGESIRVDRVGPMGIHETFEIKKTDKGYQVFVVSGDKKVERATFRRTDDKAQFEVVEDGKVTEKVDVEDFFAGGEADALATTKDKVITVKDHEPVLLQRSGDLAYLISAQTKQVYVVRKR